MKNKKLFGFTLAEVLITLAIIGVVAALTIPTLLTNYQKKETITRLKKAYAEIFQALKISEANYGAPEHWIENQAGKKDIESLNFINKYLAHSMNIRQVCTAADYEKCWAGDYFTFSGDTYPMIPNVEPTFVTNSGYSVFFWVGGLGLDPVFNRHYAFYIDVNGKAKPNVYGKDLFYFVYQKEQNGGWALLPVYYNGANRKDEVRERLSRENMLKDPIRGCSKAITGSNYDYCTALIFNDNWEVKNDYPW